MIWKWIFPLMQIKLIVTSKVLHLASNILKVRVFWTWKYGPLLCWFASMPPREVKTAFFMSHFQVSLGFCIKKLWSAQPLIWKWFFILMQIKLIFTRKVVHLTSFWKWRFLELGNGLLTKEWSDKQHILYFYFCRDMTPLTTPKLCQH